MSHPVARIAESSAAHVLGAFLLMGAWGWFANRAHPLVDALLAGAVQGTLSACVTLVLKKLVERIGAALPGGASLVAPPLCAGGLSLLFLYSVHSLAGTPEVWATIALPLTVATGYAMVYNAILWRRRRA